MGPENDDSGKPGRRQRLRLLEIEITNSFRLPKTLIIENETHRVDRSLDPTRQEL